MFAKMRLTHLEKKKRGNAFHAHEDLVDEEIHSDSGENW